MANAIKLEQHGDNVTTWSLRNTYLYTRSYSLNQIIENNLMLNSFNQNIHIHIIYCEILGSSDDTRQLIY